MLISIDPGKYATKGISNTGRIYFPTRLSSNPTIEPSGNTYQIEYNGNSYFLGEQAEQQSFDISKAETVHKLATYTAITQLIGPELRAKLTLGCPINIYKNKKLREEYKQYLLDDQLIKYGFLKSQKKISRFICKVIQEQMCNNQEARISCRPSNTTNCADTDIRRAIDSFEF